MTSVGKDHILVRHQPLNKIAKIQILWCNYSFNVFVKLFGYYYLFIFFYLCIIFYFYSFNYWLLYNHTP